MMSVFGRIALVTLLLLGGCTPKPPPEPTRLKAVDLGTGIDAEHRISAPTRTFESHTPVYVSIATEGAGPATITVQWIANTALVKQDSQSINPIGPANFSFTFVPPDGWPSGRSKVIFFVREDDKHAADFEVR